MTVYVAVISVITAVITVYDKWAAKKLPRHRIPEAVLLTLAFLGGAAAEYIIMLLIRHKTLHKRFMITLPVLTVLQVFFYLIVNTL